MAHFGTYPHDERFRREELMNAITLSIQQLTLPELEALYYDMTTKNYIKT